MDALSPKPLSPTKATELIRSIACRDELGFYQEISHAKTRMIERGLLTGDVLHVLKRGNVYENGRKSNTRWSF